MKTITTIILSILTLGAMAQTKTLYDFEAKTIDGKEFEFSSLKGKKVLVVNTASKCGYTPQYEELQKLYDQSGGGDFEIIGFPANNFMGQEPGSNDEIAGFCQKNYGVTFTMMEKVSVKGKDQHPLYAWLTDKEQNGVEDAKVKWNFQKFLIDENGNYVKSLAPGTSSLDAEVTSWLG
ncbi:MAG TPA: glutathione peroxidase, partial [Flavobacteriales bacterium]|nr:glutathione peroxidase [Flavobacteriales bacterium]